MYVCEFCEESSPEGCGHVDRKELRVMSDGRFICEYCYEDIPQMVDIPVKWSTLPLPPTYIPTK